MTARIRARLRKLAILIASGLAVLGWAAAAAYADSGEPRKGPGPLDESVSRMLTNRWEDPVSLLRVCADLTARLDLAERSGPVPWAVAEEIRTSLSAGRTMSARIEAESRPAFLQALFQSALAAGQPDEAKSCAAELVQLDKNRGWNWHALFRAALICGDKAACTEALTKIAPLIGPERVAALEPMKEQVAMIGLTPDCEMALSDGTTWTAANSKGRVVVVDFWAMWLSTSQAAVPLTRRAWAAFKDYGEFEMVGVNLDPRESRPSVTAFMKAQGIEWPAFWEGKTGDRPISFKVFAVRTIPTEMVISPEGRVIYAGLPNDPLFHYAIRAGLIKAAGGKMPASQPDTTAAAKTALRPKTPGGKVTGPPPTVVSPSPGPRASGAPVIGEADKLAEEKAASERLKIAEAFIAAGSPENGIRVLREIVGKWPNSQSGMKARLRLLTIQKHSGDIPGVDVP